MKKLVIPLPITVSVSDAKKVCDSMREICSKIGGMADIYERTLSIEIPQETDTMTIFSMGMIAGQSLAHAQLGRA